MNRHSGGPTEQNVYDDAESAEVLRQVDQEGRALGPVVIARAAEKSGAQVTWLGSNDAIASKDGRRVLIDRYFCDESVVGTRVVRDKVLTKELLEAADVSVPAGDVVRSVAEAVDFAERLGAPIVIKPKSGNMGRGVTVNITNSEEIAQAFDHARGVFPEVLAEEYLEGPEYRSHAGSGTFAGAFERVLPTVVGDGVSTIAELVDEKNRVRKLNPATNRHKIPLDEIADSYLARSGFSTQTVPEAGERVTVRNVNGITSGGDAWAYEPGSNPSLEHVTAAAVATIPGMNWGGVDSIVSGASTYVMEVNANAAVAGEMFPGYGDRMDLAATLWQRMWDASAPDLTRAAITAPALHQPTALRDAVDVSFGESGEVRVEDAVRQHLLNLGYSIQTYGVVFSATDPAGQMHWFAVGSNVHDLVRPRRLAMNYRNLRKVWRAAEVAMVRGKAVRTRQAFNEFSLARPGQRALVATDSPWGSHTHLHSEVHDDPPEVLQGERKWFVQERPDGTRLRVFASPERVLAVVGKSTEVTPAQIESASTLAVQAIRAVPGLGWGSVEVVIPNPQQTGPRARALVEALAVRPYLYADDFLLAGDLNEVYAQMAGPAHR